VANNGSLGKILVDSQGRTLYLFQADSGTKSACTGACATAWPPLRVSGKPVAGSGIAASKLRTTPRSDGKPQVTYNGHPLYRFANDQSPGDANGQGVNAFGALWYVLSPAGTTVTTSASSSSGGGGY
jgi:predicted lipoprotein with Yx(FWY)xxD motif